MIAPAGGGFKAANLKKQMLPGFNGSENPAVQAGLRFYQVS